MKTFDIYATIDCKQFKAEDEEEAKKLFWNSISDEYGVASSVENFEITEVESK
ncbi:hypothetical protein MUP79_03390 [Candidatus Bathyarchaeota archaeon]|nr:hypothetical protein [Candidatus Bathyarchaeota archaeon]